MQGQSRQVSPQWFALSVRPRQETRVTQTLRDSGYEGFTPVYAGRRRISDRLVETSLPLLPCYAFCRCFSGQLGSVVRMPGVRTVVSAGPSPLPVEEAEIAAVSAIARSGLAAAPWPKLHAGDRVRVVRGPLTGLQGVLVSLKGAHRLVVAVSLLQRSVAVEVSHEWVVPLAPVGRFSSTFYARRLCPSTRGFER